MNKIGRIVIKIGKILICLLLFSLLFDFFCQEVYESKIDKLISVDDENIAFVKVLRDSGTWKPRLSVFCMFKDNNWMILVNMRERNQDNIILYRYNGFTFYDIQKEREVHISSNSLADKLGIKLETFSDFIKNKSALDSFFETYKYGATFDFQQQHEHENIPIRLLQLKKVDLKYIDVF